MNEEYKSNSNRYKSEQLDNDSSKRVKRSATGNIIVEKKTPMKKFFNEFVSRDARNVKEYIFGDILIPAIKKAISDIVRNGIDMILYGETERSSRNRNLYDSVSYRNYSSMSTKTVSPVPRMSSGYMFAYEDVILSSRGDAEAALSTMDEIMNAYGLVRVADLNEFLRVPGDFTDNKYGWTDIRSAEIYRVRDGYKIKMPRAVPID